MPAIVETLFALIFSAIDLFRGSLPFAVVFFLLAFVGRHLRAKLQKRFKLSWVLSALLVSFLFSFIAVLIAYVAPYIISAQFASLGVVPKELSPEFLDILSFFLRASFKLIVCAIFIAFFSMPFLFLGSYIYAALEKRKFNRYFALFVATYLTTVVLFAFLLMYLQPLFLGFFYFLYSA